jgi:hypothetical protein
LIILSIAKIDHGASIMHKLVLFSLFGCSTAVALAIASNIGNNDTATTIPYPEVMNLSRVPTFDANGMVPQSNIASNSPKKSLPKQPLPKQSVVRQSATPITVDLVSSTVREATIRQSERDCTSCRNLAPTVMVLGYSTDRAIGGLNQMMY